MEMNEQEIRDYLERYAPELDADHVIAFMGENDKPEDEICTHVQWATRLLRNPQEGETGAGPSADTVADAMRRRDDRRP